MRTPLSAFLLTVLIAAPSAFPAGRASSADPAPSATPAVRVEEFIPGAELSEQESKYLERALTDLQKRYPDDFKYLRDAAAAAPDVSGQVADKAKRYGRYSRYVLESQLRKLAADIRSRRQRRAAERQTAALPAQPSVEGATDPQVLAFLQEHKASFTSKDGALDARSMAIAGRVLQRIRAENNPHYEALTEKLEREERVGRGDRAFGLLVGAWQNAGGDDGMAARNVLRLEGMLPGSPLESAVRTAGALGGGQPRAPQQEVKKPEGVPVAPKDKTQHETDIRAIADLLKDDKDGTRRDAVADRFITFIWDRDGLNDGKSFVTPELKQREGAGAQRRDGDRALVRTWIDSHIGDAAVIYYVLLDAAHLPKPDWTAGKNAEGGAKYKTQLFDSLDRWTVGRGEMIRVGEAMQEYRTGPHGGNESQQWIQVFLQDAAKEAVAIIFKTDPKAIDRIRENSNPSRPQTPGLRAPAKDDAAKNASRKSDKWRNYATEGFGPNELFGKWEDEDVVQLWFKNEDGKESPRLYSIRLVTAQNPEDHTLSTKIGIYDITDADTGKAFGRTFPLDYDSPKAFTLRDANERDIKDKRVPLQYKFKIADDGEVLFWNADEDESKAAVNNSGTPLTQERMKELRREHAMSLDNGQGPFITTADENRDYYVLPQSADGKGCIQMFNVKDPRFDRLPDRFFCPNHMEGGESKSYSPKSAEWVLGDAVGEAHGGYKRTMEGLEYEKDGHDWPVKKEEAKPTDKTVKRDKNPRPDDQTPEDNDKKKRSDKNDAGSTAEELLKTYWPDDPLKPTPDPDHWPLVYIAKGDDPAVNHFILGVPPRGDKEKAKAIIFDNAVLLCDSAQSCIQQKGDDVAVRVASIDPAGVKIPWLDMSGNQGGKIDNPNDKNGKQLTFNYMRLYRISRKALQQYDSDRLSADNVAAWLIESEFEESMKPNGVYRMPLRRDDDKADATTLKRLFKEHPGGSVFSTDEARALLEKYVNDQLALDKDYTKNPKWNPVLRVTLMPGPRSNPSNASSVAKYSTRYVEDGKEKIMENEARHKDDVYWCGSGSTLFIGDKNSCPGPSRGR